MLHSTKDLARLSLHATDGNIGSLEDVYFDDIHWRVRYIVVDSGHWLPGRLVLVSPAAIARADFHAQLLNVKLTKKQVEESPGIETHETVSRQHEQHMSKYYGWPVYWPAASPLDPEAGEPDDGDSNLRSASEMRGYAVHAKDGDIGHVVDFMIDDAAWEIRYLVVDTGKWLPGRKVLIDPRATDEVDWAKSTVRVHLTKDEMNHCPSYEPSDSREAADKAHRASNMQWPTYWY